MTERRRISTVRQVLKGMSLEQKVGQMFLLAFAGSDPGRAEAMIRECCIGGCYLSNDNGATPEQAADMSTALQSFALSSGARIPLLLGADQEGAWSVMMPDSTTGPGNLGLGAADLPRSTFRMYRVIADELKSVGYNTVFAPCVDVNSNPQNSIIGMRSFGENPLDVAKHSVAAVRGVHSAGVIATAKHFPGHGDTSVDSHREIPRNDRARGEVEKIDLLPFKSVIRAGIDIVMTSHILFPALDEDRPATLSRYIITDLLRRQLNFAGVVVSDSMNMGAMRKHYAPAESSVFAVAAGVDMIMLAEEHYDHNPGNYENTQRTCVNGVVSAVKNGRIPEADIDSAVARILSLKLKYGLFANSFSRGRLDPRRVGTSKNRRVERAVADRLVSVVRNRAHAWPIPSVNRIAVIQTVPDEAYEILSATRGIGPNQTEPAFRAFSDAILELRPDVDIYQRDKAVDPSTLIDLSNDYDTVVAVTEDYPIPGVDFETACQKEMVNTLAASLGRKLIVVALRTPYELNDYPAVETYICTCSSRSCSAAAAARAVCGKIDARAELPVTVG